MIFSTYVLLASFSYFSHIIKPLYLFHAFQNTLYTNNTHFQSSRFWEDKLTVINFFFNHRPSFTVINNLHKFTCLRTRAPHSGQLNKKS